ncbi:MAG: hypothetical protein ABIH99_05750 [Candidatus Micrarchaeota archaeon]
MTSNSQLPKKSDVRLHLSSKPSRLSFKERHPLLDVFFEITRIPKRIESAIINMRARSRVNSQIRKLGSKNLEKSYKAKQKILGCYYDDCSLFKSAKILPLLQKAYEKSWPAFSTSQSLRNQQLYIIITEINHSEETQQGVEE